MSLKKNIIIAFALLLNTALFSQVVKEGSIVIHQDSRVGELIEKHISFNEKQLGIPGFRVQIYFDSGNNSKSRANKAKSDFMFKYPGVEAYVIFQSPNYVVRVGDFRSSVEAQGFVHTIKPNYPNAYFVSDEIQFPKD